MIDARELRIGNLVSQLYSFGCDGNKKTEWRDWELDLIDLQDVQSRPKIYKPIPLTKERILMFGFTLINNVDYESNCGTLDLELTDAGFLFDSRILIKSVHQLQNLYFALTGQELELK